MAHDDGFRINLPTAAEVMDRERSEVLAPWLAEGAPTPPPYADGATVESLCCDLVTLLDSDDREERLQAMGRILPYVSRGGDLADLLGFTEP